MSNTDGKLGLFVRLMATYGLRIVDAIISWDRLKNVGVL